MECFGSSLDVENRNPGKHGAIVLALTGLSYAEQAACGYSVSVSQVTAALHRLTWLLTSAESAWCKRKAQALRSERALGLGKAFLCVVPLSIQNAMMGLFLA